MPKSRKKLGELLFEAGLINEFQLQAAIAYQREWGGRLGSILIKKGFISEGDMVSVLETQLGYPCLLLDAAGPPTKEILRLVSAEIARRFGIFPVGVEGKTLLVAISDPTDLKTLDDLSFLFGMPVKPVLALESDIERAIETHFEGKIVPGKVHRIDRQRLEEVAQKPPTPEVTFRRTSPSSPIESPLEQPLPLRQEVPQKKVLECLIDLLIKKGLFTKEELITLINEKK